MIVYRARWILPVTSPPVEHGAVAVDAAGRIALVGPRDGAPRADDVRVLGDAALLPGLVNAHTHLELTVMRGFLEELPFVEWIGTLTRARRDVLDDAALLDAARLGIREGLLAGVTTFADTGFSGTPMRALVESGARGVVFQEVFGPAPGQRAESLAGLQAAVARLREIETPLVRVGVSPHAVYSVHEDLIVDVCAWAVAEGLPIAMHLAESREEMEFLREARGPFAESHRARGIDVVRRSHSPVHLLVELGVTTVARPLLIHCVQLDESDVHFVARDGCPVAHCPASNAKLGHGTAPLVELLAAGAVVGLGSDSVASNNRMDLLDEARLAVLAQRARLRRHDALSAAAALELATLGGARALGLDGRVGSLEVGKDADLAAFPLDEPRGIAAGDVAGALVFSLAGRPASLVAVAGRELVRDGRVLAPDDGVTDRVAAAAGALRAWRARPH